MKNKTILITGASSGIGRDLSIALSKKGYIIIATTHREESVEELKLYSSDQGVSLHTVFKLDITDENDYKKLEDIKIDVLINNAGVGESGSLSEIPIEKIRSNFETNVFGTLNLSQLILKKMMIEDSGKIIFISSLFGRATNPFWGPYCMTKFSLSVAADVLRREIKKITKKIHISVVEPGAYHTGFNQKVIATKYQWMDETSYFYNILNKIKKNEEKLFKLVEVKTTKSVVEKIIKVVESKKPKLRYSVPFWQYFPIQILRIFGR